MTNEEKYLDGNQLLREIVNYGKIPAAITGFWDRLTQSGRGSEGWNIISVINSMSKQKIPRGINLMAWYEILRDIYIIRVRHQESLSLSAKEPMFTTFDRSFEQYAFLPEFWFGKMSDQAGAKHDLRSNPEELLFPVERYMYNQDGGACWTALDWNSAKYCFRVVCEPSRLAKEPPIFKLAALLLTAHFIVTGQMGLYVTERNDVKLPYAGIVGGGQTGSELLKYYHFDRFTRFSFIRDHELRLDADSQSCSAILEPQWQEIAAMTEFILLSKSARATRTTCTRVGLNAFMNAMYRLRSENALGPLPEIGKIISLLDSPDFAQMSADDLLHELNIRLMITPCDYYFRQNGIVSADDFWNVAEDAFREIQDTYNSVYYLNISKFSAAEYARRNNALIQDDSIFLARSLLSPLHRNELRGRMTGLRLRTALKNLLISGQLELNCVHLAQLLKKEFNSEELLLYMPAENKEVTLPTEWLTVDIAPRKTAEILNSWCREILSESSRDEKTGEITRDYSKLDMESIQRASDRLWTIYFSDETERFCRDRWMLSLRKAIQILDGTRDKLSGVRLPEGNDRELLLEKIRREYEEMSMGTEFNADAAEKRLAGFEGYSLSDVNPGGLRALVIIDLIARLMVSTAQTPSFDAVWNNFDELKIFFTHLLCATGGKLDSPLPFHVGIFSDSLLRLSRNNNQDQRDNIDRLLKHKYDNAGERYMFLLSLLKYLKQSQHPNRTLDAIIGNPAMAEYASAERLSNLKDFLGKR